MNAPFQARAEAEIREIMDHWRQAVRKRDLTAILAIYAPEVVAYDAVAQLQFKGVEAYGEHWRACLSMCADDMIFEPVDMNVVADDEIAYCHGLLRCGGTGPDGVEKSGWMRMTVCLRRLDGQWRVLHEHYSAPFDMAGEKVLWLEP